MTDEEYATKLRAEAHIDEIVEVSKRGEDAQDRKNHRFAKDGFNYRMAYFEDPTGYYKLTISVGKNGYINTIYNVGKIEKANFPMSGQTAMGAQRPEGEITPGKMTVSDSIIPEEPRENNKRFSLKDTSPADIDRLREENQALREANELLREQFKLTNGRKVKRKDVDALSGKILKAYQSKYDRDTLTDNLITFYDAVHKASNDPVKQEEVVDTLYQGYERL